jgi:hypothetical protein
MGLAILLVGSYGAHAQPYSPCPSITIGWTQPIPGSPITSAQYDSSAQLLYVIFNSTQASAFIGVPVGVMNSFSRAQTQQQAQQVYAGQVLPIYHALLLAQSNNCPLRFETGAYIWSK